MKNYLSKIAAIIFAVILAAGCQEKEATLKVSGHIVDPFDNGMYDGTIVVRNGRIARIQKGKVDENAPYILRGYVESPVVLEHTLVLPENYASAAVRKGIVAADIQYEGISGILGEDGDEFIKANCSKVHFHFGSDYGQLQQGDNADFILVDNLEDNNIIATYIDGLAVYENGDVIERNFHKGDIPLNVQNNFSASTISPDDIRTSGGYNIGADIIKMVRLDRFGATGPRVSFVKGLGLKKGAVASTICNWTRDIVAVGVNDSDIAAAINLIVEQQGGVVVVCPDDILTLPLPIAGIISPLDVETVTSQYGKLQEQAVFQGYEFDTYGFDFKGLGK